MSIDTHIPSRTTQTLPLSIRDMLLRLGIAILLGHPEIDYMNSIGSLCSWPSYQKVVWLDIAVDEVLFVDCLDAGELGEEKVCEGKEGQCERTGGRPERVWEGRGRGRETNHLLGNHNDRLDTELPPTHVKQVLQTRSKQVDHKNVVQPFLTKVVHLRDAGWTRKKAMISVLMDWGRNIGRRERWEGREKIHSREPARILYVLYSSRS